MVFAPRRTRSLTEFLFSSGWNLKNSVELCVLCGESTVQRYNLTEAQCPYLSADVRRCLYLSVFVFISVDLGLAFCPIFCNFMELYNLHKMNHPMFEIRPYNKAELALLYNPHATQESALKTLYRWINACPLLVEELRSLRYNPRRHVFLRPEVEAIVKYLGEP